MPREYAEGDFGELNGAFQDGLPSSPRPKEHYRGETVYTPSAVFDAFAANEARWLLTLHAANLLLHAARTPRFGMARLYATTVMPPERAGKPAAQRVQATLPLAGYTDRSSPASTVCR